MIKIAFVLFYVLPFILINAQKSTSNYWKELFEILDLKYEQPNRFSSRNFAMAISDMSPDAKKYILNKKNRIPI